MFLEGRKMARLFMFLHGVWKRAGYVAMCSRYGQFLLLAVLISYKVSVNVELGKTEPLLPGEIQG